MCYNSPVAVERYRSGHNGADSKSVSRFYRHVGSNPTRSAKNETPQTGCFRFWRNERVGFGPTCPRGKRAECQHSVLSGEAGNEASLLARYERRVRSKHEQRRLSERYRRPFAQSTYSRLGAASVLVSRQQTQVACLWHSPPGRRSLCLPAPLCNLKAEPQRVRLIIYYSQHISFIS